MRQTEAEGAVRRACPSKGQSLSWWEKSRRRYSHCEDPGAGPGQVPPRWQREGASWACLSSDHTDPTQPGWAGQTLGQRSSCLHPATRLAPATHTHRRFSGYQAEPEKLSGRVGGLQPEPWAAERSPTPVPPPGPALGPGSLGFLTSVY